MKAFVTGCAGFIGSHLCEKLVLEGMTVLGIDSLTDYYDPEIKRANIGKLTTNPGFSFIHDDILSADLRAVLQNVDFIFHLAAQPGVRGSWGDKFSIYVQNNIMATQRLLEAAKDLPGLKKFLYASSSSIYGQITEESVNEEHRTSPHSPYGATKLAGENLCFLYNANFGVPVVATRLFTVYGPRQRPDMAFTRLIYAAISGKTFSLYGDGNQERDFTYVLDVAQAMWLAATNAGAAGIFNVGGGHVVSMNEVVETVEEITGSRIKISRKTAERGDVRRTGADITKCKKVLGFSPAHDIDDGLKEQVKFVSDHTDMYLNSISLS